MVQMVVDGLNIPETDTEQLSAQWCSVVRSIDYPSSGIALRVLSSIVKAYLSGRGCGMGNLHGLNRHYNKVARLTSTVLFDATERYDEMAKWRNGEVRGGHTNISA